jgi:hypothetical protein
MLARLALHLGGAAINPTHEVRQAVNIEKTAQHVPTLGGRPS